MLDEDDERYRRVEGGVGLTDDREGGRNDRLRE